MATATYIPISTQTLGSPTASITFSSIPSTYTDLRLVFVGQASASNNLFVHYNGDTGTNYSRIYIYGSGTAATSGNNINFPAIVPAQISGLGASSIPHFHQLDIFSYAGSTNKTSLSQGAEDENGTGYTIASVEMWRNTAAITSITLYLPNAGNIVAGSVATLWGI